MQPILTEEGTVVHDEAYTCFGNAEYACDSRKYYCDGVSKNHLPDKTRTDVLRLDFMLDMGIELMPLDIGKFFPNLEVFECSFGEIYYIEKEDFEQFPKLKVLDLFFNKIKALPGDLFANNPDIVFFDLGHNPIDHVESSFFDKLDKLLAFGFAETECHPSPDIYPVDELKGRVTEQCIKAGKIIKRTRPKDKSEKQVDEQCLFDFEMSVDLPAKSRKVKHKISKPKKIKSKKGTKKGLKNQSKTI